MISVYGVNGKVRQRQSVKVTLEWLQLMVGGYVQLVTLLDGSQIWMDEEGKIKGKPINAFATRKLWEPSFGRTDVLVGTIVHLTGPDLAR
jgi:hypothetical protein